MVITDNNKNQIAKKSSLRSLKLIRPLIKSSSKSLLKSPGLKLNRLKKNSSVGAENHLDENKEHIVNL